jgi:di- and tripeptidase
MLAWLDEVFDAQGVHFPMGQSSDQAHLTDERLRILNLETGRQIMHNYFGS